MEMMCLQILGRIELCWTSYYKVGLVSEYQIVRMLLTYLLNISSYTHHPIP